MEVEVGGRWSKSISGKTTALTANSVKRKVKILLLGSTFVSQSISKGGGRDDNVIFLNVVDHKEGNGNSNTDATKQS